MPNEPLVETTSEEVQDILSHVPNWLIRWGVTVIFSILLLLFSMTWIISYPDTLSGKATLKTASASVTIVSKASGELVKIHFQENEQVKKGDVIAEVTSTLSHDGLTFLQAAILGTDSFLNHGKPINLRTPYNLLLGDVQSEYHRLQQSLDKFHQQASLNDFNRRKVEISDKITFHTELLEISLEQKKLTQLELNNKEIKYQGNKKMYEGGGMAKFDFLSLENEYLQKKKEVQSMRKSCVQIRLGISELKSELEALITTHEQLLAELKNEVEQAARNLKKLIDNWARNHVIHATMDGRLSYLTEIHEMQFINSGTPLFTIIPNDDTYKAQVYVPAARTGKLAIGQTVRLRFDNYPAQEFGIVKGKVSKISLLPEGDQYRIEVALDNGLNTSYKKTISFKPQMTGQADIVVDNILLIERIFSNINKLLKKE